MSDSYKKQLKEAEKFIVANDNFLIVSHVQPDGDTISSSLAVAQILKHLNKKYTIINQDQPSKKFQYLAMFDLIQEISAVDKKFTNIITVDVADYLRAGEISNLLAEDYHLLNIDHHPTNDYFGKYNIILPSAAATVEIIYDLAKEMNIPFNQELAESIYTGLLTDTGGFRYSNTSPKVLAIAAEMLEYDIKPGKIAEVTLETVTLSYLELLKHVLENIELLENNSIAFTVLPLDVLENVDDSSDSEGLVNYTRNIEGVEVGVLIKEIGQHLFKASLRSKEVIDVGDIAKSFGGGGHTRAAGYTYKGTISNLKDELLAKIKASQGWNRLER